VTVECYAGYRGDQEPRRFRVGDSWIEVAEIEDRWQEPGQRGFRVLGTDGNRYRLVHREAEDRWIVDLAY
jgi:hypothetical protein